MHPIQYIDYAYIFIAVDSVTNQCILDLELYTPWYNELSMKCTHVQFVTLWCQKWCSYIYVGKIEIYIYHMYQV